MACEASAALALADFVWEHVSKKGINLRAESVIRYRDALRRQRPGDADRIAAVEKHLSGKHLSGGMEGQGKAPIGSRLVLARRAGAAADGAGTDDAAAQQ